MDEFESPLDRIIREARQNGAFDHLPGKGQPIQWEDDSMVPEDQRMANHLLKNSGFAPEWAERRRVLDQQYTDLCAAWQQARQQHSAGQLPLTELRQAASKTAAAIRQLNHKVIEYNLRAPAEVLQRLPYPIADEIKEMEG